MATILISGGTGMIGSALQKFLLDKGHKVIVLLRPQSRNKPLSQDAQISYANWNVETGEIDKNAIANTDHIIHLAGASVAEKRWTDARKKEIVDSRVESGMLIVESLKTIPNKVKTVISATAVGWYGPDLPSPLSGEG